MASNMSQWEIDQLLRSIGEGQTGEATPSAPALPAPTRPLRPYDLRQPNRFSKDHLRTLQEIHEQFARNLGPALGSYLRLNVRAQLTTVEEMTLAAYTAQTDEPMLVAAVDLSPLEYPVSFALGIGPTLAALDRLCGGAGLASLSGRQSITKIEQAILYPLVRLVAQNLADAWSPIIAVRATVADVSPPGASVRLGQDNEAAAVFTIEFKVGETSGPLSVCVPFLTIQAIADQMHSKIWNVKSQGPRVVTHQEQVIGLLLDVPTAVTVILGDVDLPASALLGLHVGDVIQLGVPINAELDVAVEECIVFRGRPGHVSGKLATRLTSVNPEILAHPLK